MGFGEKIKALREKKGIPQEAISKKLGYITQSYISDVENNKFIPKEAKLVVFAKVLGIPWEEMEGLVIEARLEQLGVIDPAFTLMFKNMPKLTRAEKKSILKAYEAVMKAREAKEARR